MIDHFNLPVSDLEISKVFYETVLRTLGVQMLMRDGDAIGFGNDTWAFGIVQETMRLPRLHVAFTANSPDTVNAFYRAALDAGARDNGPPGPRPHYGPSYYSAFVRDPDEHNVEVVWRGDRGAA